MAGFCTDQARPIWLSKQQKSGRSQQLYFTCRGTHPAKWDEGPGIPDYAQEKVFEKFFSLSRPSTGKKSTSLGLSFVREVVNLHGGQISLLNKNPGCKVILKI
ncbi:MAG: hypothetical protein HQM15_03255 [Deltaproteobacteria bacterium]|nr:hypothetical protein [Deltaproteobacteria bacterium]